MGTLARHNSLPVAMEQPGSSSSLSPDADAGAQVRGGGAKQHSYCNPVIADDFPDPCVVRGKDGFFYCYATQSPNDGRMDKVQVARSHNLVDWERLPDALPQMPRWSEANTPVLSPNAIAGEERTFLYFAAKAKEAGGMCIGVAMADTPAGPFQPTAEPLVCGHGFENIDPFPFDDEATGRRLLYWGSGRIRVRELAADRCSFAPYSEATTLIRPAPDDVASGFQRLVEAASVVVRNGRYYLFYSGDNCCHGDPNYAVMVARSEAATGPFTLHTPKLSNENLVVEARGRWQAPGHCTIIRDDGDDDWMLFHAIDRNHSESPPQHRGKQVRRVLLLDRLTWKDGWPQCRGPTEGPQPAPHFRRRQNAADSG